MTWVSIHSFRDHPMALSLEGEEEEEGLNELRSESPMVPRPDRPLIFPTNVRIDNSNANKEMPKGHPNAVL
jgi:hypothetical protein